MRIKEKEGVLEKQLRQLRLRFLMPLTEIKNNPNSLSSRCLCGWRLCV